MGVALCNAGVAASTDGESVASSPTSASNSLVGFVHTVEDAYDVMRSYEVHTTSKFVQVRTVQDFGKDLDCLKYQHRVRFEDRKQCKDSISASENRLPIKDTPFLLLGTKWFECQHGRDYHVNFKRKRNEAIETGNIIVKRRNKATKTKKVGCLAKVWMKDVLVFPKKKLRPDVKTARKMLSKEIRAGTVKGERRIYVFLPHPGEHKNHVVGEASGETQRVDPQVIDNIYWLVRQGIHTTRDVQLHLERFVKEELFRYQTPPSASNRRFYPTKKDIRNHIMAARKGRLPPKDRAEIAKQSSSLAASMCASNKLAFPKTNQTTRYRLLAKKIMSLSKKVTNPTVIAEATKKMEDLVAFLRAGAQKEERVQRMEKRAKEPSVLKSTSLERPPLRKRRRADKDSGETIRHISQQTDAHRKETQQNQETNQDLNTGNLVAHINQPVEQVERQHVDLSTREPSQHVMFQPQTQGLVLKVVDMSFPETPAQIPLPLGNHQGGQSNNGASSLLHRILQGGTNQPIAVIPQQSHYQPADTSGGQILGQVDPRLTYQ
ncbi:uncharacterized protein [Amphiura filiformis]|uniref:uncharacterized protein n=1 Tax=Amphiura filiformis TaxID=82378 RepID=UPI003B21A861